jgi:chromosome segregation ATPase
LERTSTTLAGFKADFIVTQERLEMREAEFADLDQRHTATLSELDTKRITISDLGTRLATQTARGDEFERALSGRRSELSEERLRLADLAKNLLAEQERGLVLEKRIRELEEERDIAAASATARVKELDARIETLTTDAETLRAAMDERMEALRKAENDRDEARTRIAAVEAKGAESGSAKAAELRAMAERLELIKAEKASLEGALATSREERARLEKEMKAQGRTNSVTSEEIRAENADLRRRIEEVADSMMRVAGGGAATGKGRRKTAN